MFQTSKATVFLGDSFCLRQIGSMDVSIVRILISMFLSTLEILHLRPIHSDEAGMSSS